MFVSLIVVLLAVLLYLVAARQAVMTPFRFFWNVVLPFIAMLLGLTYSAELATTMMNMPSTFAFFGGIAQLIGMVLVCVWGANRLWFK